MKKEIKRKDVTAPRCSGGGCYCRYERAQQEAESSGGVQSEHDPEPCTKQEEKGQSQETKRPRG